MKLKLITLILLLFFSLKGMAQDPIFTQYFMVPETLNPGFTGFLETSKVGVLHKTQWPDLNFRVDTDYAFANTWVESLNSGFGLNVMNSREKFTNYSYTQINLAYSYRVQLNDEWYFRPAIEMGLGNKSYNFQNILLEDQINIGFGNNGSSIDPLAMNEKVNFFDLSAGMLFNNENAWIGASLKHLTKPNISFSNTGNVPLDMFFSANAGYELKIADYFDILSLPYETKLMFTSNYMHQGVYNRLDLGTGVVMDRFFLGATLATNPIRKASNSPMLTSVNLYGGLQYQHFKFGYSYDFNLTKIGNTGGIYELSLIYLFDFEKSCFSCPDYY